MRYSKPSYLIDHFVGHLDLDIGKKQFTQPQPHRVNNRSLETVEISAHHPECFSLFHNEQQIGFALVALGYNTTASISDVITFHEYRGIEPGKLLVETAVTDHRWQNELLLLAKDDAAHELYERHNFKQSAKLKDKR